MMGPEDFSNQDTGFEELGLKIKTDQELFELLLQADPSWTEDEKFMVTESYRVACIIHEGDKHRDLPYTYHLLRNANRVTGYLHITDPYIIAAIILHDSAEDHPDAIMPAAIYNNKEGPLFVSPPENESEKQRYAFKDIAMLFSPRVAELVASVTNPPAENMALTYEQKISNYVDKVSRAVVDPESWVIKFVDLLDNGVGIVHSLDSDNKEHYEYKYGSALPVVERRFYQPDIQEILDDQAKAYVVHQIKLGKERLAF